MGIIAISACLMGTKCRYDGSSAFNNELFHLVKDENVLLFCPERLGNLPTPRKPAEIVCGDGEKVISGDAVVMDKSGIDITSEFVRGAIDALDLFSKNGVSIVVLKDRSPSCGVDNIYDGNFSGTIVKGCGVLTAMLLNKDFVLFSDKNLLALKQWMELERVENNE